MPRLRLLPRRARPGARREPMCGAELGVALGAGGRVHAAVGREAARRREHVVAELGEERLAAAVEVQHERAGARQRVTHLRHTRCTAVSSLHREMVHGVGRALCVWVCRSRWALRLPSGRASRRARRRASTGRDAPAEIRGDTGRSRRWEGDAGRFGEMRRACRSTAKREARPTKMRLTTCWSLQVGGGG